MGSQRLKGHVKEGISYYSPKYHVLLCQVCTRRQPREERELEELTSRPIITLLYQIPNFTPIPPSASIQDTLNTPYDIRIHSRTRWTIQYIIIVVVVSEEHALITGFEQTTQR